jgi:outer membrane lipoprotein-sorting protein
MMKKIIFTALIASVFFSASAFADVTHERRALAQYISAEINMMLKGE